MIAEIPTSTYRLQFNSGFTFDAAAALVPYLHTLGISHIYASPWLRSRTGSTHGYDVVDFATIEPEIGGAAGFENLHRVASAYGLRHLLDFVPNHMGVGGSLNAWWLTLLEEGRAAPTARYFDIEWNLGEPHLKNKILLPILGEHYGDALLHNVIRLRFDLGAGRFSAWYYRQRLPIALPHYGYILRLAAADINGSDADLILDLARNFDAAVSLRPTARRARMTHLTARLSKVAKDSPPLATALAAACERIARPGEHDMPPPLHEILKDQHYALSYWGTAADEVNYRRFFNINELAGLRMENPALFEPVHALVGRLIAEGKIHGLRIDHIDGLLDPKGYCTRLRDLTRSLAGDDFYVVVEKILARHEHLRGDWPVHGTTGYDFIAQASNVLIDQAGERALTAAYARFTGEGADFTDILVQSKTEAIDTLFRSELRILGRRLHRITRRFWKTPDFTEHGLARALRDLAVHLPVYRTYVDRAAIDHTTVRSAEDRRDLDGALEQALARWKGSGRDTLTFVASVLNGDFERDNPSLAGVGVGFALKFQQFTAPATAKGMEDTAFYRYHRLISLNEVGGDPRQFGSTVADFHEANRIRAACAPHGMLTTATHDTKRGEDARARIHVLSEIPETWTPAARQWAALNARHKITVGGRAVPNANEEYLLYQTLVGVWPIEDVPDLQHLRQRLSGFMIKALREAKRNSLWEHPDKDYEAAALTFVERILDTDLAGAFLEHFIAFHEPVARAGMLNSLSQTTLKLTSPGVPDIYQGTETWDFSLVDPDNRRPVDFRARQASLIIAEGADLDALLATWRTGDVKTFITHRLLMLRRGMPDVFRDGGYEPLPVAGSRADHIIAFRRGNSASGIAVIVGRHFAKLLEEAPLPKARVWGDTFATLPINAAVDIFTGRAAVAHMPIADALDRLPIAVFAWG
jgi:(1->4)-alpha-D-glucan 1-alpha-D-glucosylmutase